MIRSLCMTTGDDKVVNMTFSRPLLMLFKALIRLCSFHNQSLLQAMVDKYRRWRFRVY